jgi:HK97 family phage major capsid protein
MSRVDEARSRWEQACDSLDEVADRLNGLDDETPEEVRQAHQERFDDAERAAQRASEEHERQCRIAAVRSATLPETDAAPDDAETRTPDEARTEPGHTPVRTSTTRSRSPRVTVVSEPLTYERTPNRAGERSYFRDLIKADQGDMTARTRLQRHAREMTVERRDLSSTDGVGGEFVPPIWLMDEVIPVVRMGRQFANAVRQRPLPAGTDSVSIPKVLTGASVAAQADLGLVSETDPSTGSVSVGVKTLAGTVDISRQAVDRQPMFDDVIMEDLLADYDLRLDLQAISGSGSGANAKGVLSDSSRIQVTYTDASPTVAELYSKIADATQQILTNTNRSPDLIVMHPRRWAWATAASDTTGRPLIVPTGASQNAPGNSTAITQLGPVGNLYGLPVIIDANLPTNLGAGTNEDTILVLASQEVWLMEDTPVKTDVTEAPGFKNLYVSLRAFNYFAFTSERLSKAVASIGGTGLVAPTF